LGGWQKWQVGGRTGGDYEGQLRTDNDYDGAHLGTHFGPALDDNCSAYPLPVGTNHQPLPHCLHTHRHTQTHSHRTFILIAHTHIRAEHWELIYVPNFFSTLFFYYFSPRPDRPTDLPYPTFPTARIILPFLSQFS